MRVRRPYDVVIVGGGIAGMTAAIYALRAGMSVLLIEEKLLGGQIVEATDVRNWPGEERISGEKLAERIYHQMNKLNEGGGLEIVYAKVLEVRRNRRFGAIEVITDDEDEMEFFDEGEARQEMDGDAGAMDSDADGTEKGYLGRNLIIATGSRERPMGVPREAEMVGKGVSYCATCDGALYQGKDIAVVGGGNTAFYDVLYLANLARKVYLVHRREEFRAEKELVRKARKLKNVEFVLGYVLEEILGEEKVEGLRVMKSGEAKDLEVAGIFVAVGREPATKVFSGLVKLDAEGYVVAGENCRTSAEEVFVAGDCRTKGVRQLVTAAADGAIAATAAVEYLNKAPN